MAEMERIEAKGGATPEEMEALAQELSSKMLLTTWKATRWEVTNVSTAHPVASPYDRANYGRLSARLSMAHCTNLGYRKMSAIDGRKRS